MANLPSVTAATFPTPEEVLSTLLAHARFRFAEQGITVNVEKGSELYLRYQAIAGRVSQAISNGEIKLRDTSPLTATGDALVAWADLFRVYARVPTSARGYLTAGVTTSIATTAPIPDGFVATNNATGIKYKADGAQVVADGGSVRMVAVSAGSDTDAAAGASMTWDSATIPQLKQAATVAVGGIDGGADADDEEQLRTRLLRKLRLPPVGGNSGHTIQLAEEASAAVVAAYDYPSVRGPGSYDVVIVGEPDDPVLTSATIATVEAAVQAEKPGYANGNFTTIELETLDAIIDLNLPLPKFAGGAGGGWKDANPWPSTAETGVNVFAEVSVVTGNVITVNSTATDIPTVGSHVAFWDWELEQFVEFAITAVGGAPGAYTITLDGSTASAAFIDVGQYVSAAAHFLQDYADTFLAAVNTLGPGEKTANVDILRFGRRVPAPDTDAPYSLTSTQLAAVQTAHPEVGGIAFAGRFETGTKTTRTAPSVPATTADAPKRLALKHLSFRSAD